MIARLIHRFPLIVIGIWALAAVLGNSLAPPLEQLISVEDQPFSPYGTPTSLAVQRSAAAFHEAAGDNIGYLVLERDRALDARDRAFYDRAIAALRADPQHVVEVSDWWAIPATADAVLSADHHVVTASMLLGGMVGTSQASQAVTAARTIVAQQHPPDGLQVFITGPGATVTDEFAAFDRQIQLITVTTLAVLLVLLLILYRSLVTALVPLASVLVALTVVKPIISVLVDHRVIGVSLFSLGLSLAVVVGAGTGFAISMIGRYHERRREEFSPEEALEDAYRGVVPAIVGSTLMVVAPLGAVGWLNLARIGIFATTGILCSIGVLVMGLAALTLTPALIALASRADLAKPPRLKNLRVRWRRIGIQVARWPAPILVGCGVLIFVLTVSGPGVPIGWDETAATASWAESNRGYQAVNRHFGANQLLPEVVTIQTDHDLRNPAGLSAIERVTGAIMGVTGVRMVQSASHPNGLVSKQAAMTASAGNLGDRLDEFSDRLAARDATFTNLGTAGGDMMTALDLLQNSMQQGTYGIGQASLAVHLMQVSIDKIRARAADVSDIFDPLRSFVSAIPDCPTTPVCSAAQDALQWSNTVVDRATTLADSGEQLGKGIADVASAASSLPNAFSMVNTQVAAVRGSATDLKQAIDNSGATPIQQLPDRLHELAAVSRSRPGTDLYASRTILTDPNMRVALDGFFSPDGHATRLLVFGDGHEWGSDGAQRAGEIRTAITDATKDGTLKPTGVELTGVGPATRDLQTLIGGDLTLLVVITLAVILTIAALLLRSPLAGLIVTGTIAASYVGALGASVLIWQRVFGYALHWSVPPIAFVLLVSMGSAGNLLFALRIREEAPAGPRTSIIRAFAATGAVVTTAGIVIGLPMFGLALSSVLNVAQIGVTVGVGLLLNTLVTRAFVLPALMAMLGRWLWWPSPPVAAEPVP
ncbi:RND family transporter [Mycobacterium kubicae]|uniref:MMPL/RND family transporter n=1 Tax=Mycobacterium kubicae TaxID=120959 RepID=UPI0007FF69BD|nr:RND family transporter [Mycobacterium kubicae]OBK50743.1 transporter [Mycobacterium kubicae]